MPGRLDSNSPFAVCGYIGGEYVNDIDNVMGNHTSVPNMGLGLSIRPVLVPQIGMNTPLGFHVPQALKEKVWEGAYVDFVLLHKETANAVVARAPDLTLQFVMDGNQLVLRKPGHLRKQLETLDMWQSAFHTFMAIYTVKHPTRYAELSTLRLCVWLQFNILVWVGVLMTSSFV